MITFLVHVTEPDHNANKEKAGKKTKMAELPYKSSAEGLIDFLPLPSLLVNSNRELVGVNSEARTLFKNIRVGEDLTFSTRNPDILDALIELKEGTKQLEKDLVILGENERSYHMTGRTLLSEKTRKGLYLLVFTDVTHRRDAEKIRSAFIANVSHELRSPLSTLIGAVETLKTSAREDPAAHARFLGLMEEEAWRMKRLVDDLLSLSKLEAGEHVPPKGEIAIPRLLSQVMGNLEGRAMDRGMKITCTCAKELPKIAGDFDEIQEVLDNLIDNAIKYGKEGTPIALKASLDENPEGMDGPALVISVQNHGEVIPKDQIPRLTERFYRVDKSRSRALGGTGLGLAIVKHIIKHHRGKMEVESSPRKGTVFRIFLSTGQGQKLS